MVFGVNRGKIWPLGKPTPNEHTHYLFHCLDPFVIWWYNLWLQWKDHIWLSEETLNWELICMNPWSDDNGFTSQWSWIRIPYQSERHTKVMQTADLLFWYIDIALFSWEKSRRFSLELLVEHKHKQSKWRRLQIYVTDYVACVFQETGIIVSSRWFFSATSTAALCE